MESSVAPSTHSRRASRRGHTIIEAVSPSQPRLWTEPLPIELVQTQAQAQKRTRRPTEVVQSSALSPTMATDLPRAHVPCPVQPHAVAQVATLAPSLGMGIHIRTRRRTRIGHTDETAFRFE